jgi:hypothetical protein
MPDGYDLVGDSPQISIDDQGNFDPATVTENNGGVIKFEVSEYPTINGQLMNQCILTCTVSWAYVSQPDNSGGGTIKVGS